MLGSTCRENLLILATTYAESEEIPLSTVSRRAYGGASFFEGLKAKKCSISIDRADELVAWFREHWPVDLPWPFLRPMHFSVPKDRRELHDETASA